MANHCYNYAYFEGSEKDITRAVEAITNAKNNETLWWETYKKVFGDKYDYSSEDVYTEFGSKWFDCEIDYNNYSMTLTGDSAWSPVLAFYQKLCETFNLSCSADYEECGMDFAGWWEYRDGTLIKDRQVSYLLYRYETDPTSAFESLLDDAKEGIFTDYEDFKKCVDANVLSRLSLSQKEKIRNAINSII